MTKIKTVFPQYRLFFCIATVFFCTGTIHALSATDTIQAESFSGQSGVTTEACSEGGQDVTSIQNNDNIHFLDMDFGSSGIQCFEARITSYGVGGYIQVRLDSTTGALVGTCDIQPITGSWQTWTSKACNITGATGVHTLYLVFTGSTGNLFSLNWIKFHGTPSLNTAGWRQTTNTAKGAWKGTQNLTASTGTTPVIEIVPDTMYQRVFGWGGAFNDNGAMCIASLSANMRAAVMKELFDPVNGCKFNIGRVPIGMSDFTITQDYSLDETAGDYSMTRFSIRHDSLYNIPFVKAAMAAQPNLMLYGSPWTPPTWMKNTNSWQGNVNGVTSVINANAQTFTAYALYFRKFVLAWKQAGTSMMVVFPQNEPGWTASGHPSCSWTGTTLKNFVRDYLGPDFTANNIPTEIWMGTFNNSDFTNDAKPTLDDAAVRPYIKGFGFQREGYTATGQAMAYAKDLGLNWHSMQTENMCWSGANNWTDAMNTYLYIWRHETNNTNIFNFWNMILDSNYNYVTWMTRAQNSMITINHIATPAPTVKYNPEFYVMKHWSYYIAVGAVRLKTTNTNTNLVACAFKNPDGTIILEVQNTSTGTVSPLIKLGSQVFTPALAASSVNTFNIGGTEPAVNWVPMTEVQSLPYKSTFAATTGILGVYDIRGRLIKIIERSSTHANATGVLWDRTDASGRKAGPGLYIIMNRTGKAVVKKAICQ
jgi:glucosylceramidase